MARKFGLPWYVLSAFLFWLFSSRAVIAKPLTFIGAWNFQTDDEKQKTLGQNYRLSLNQRVSVTEAITLAARMNYHTSIQKSTTADEEQKQRTETLNPSLTFGLTNEIFLLNLTGRASENKISDGPTMSTRNWESTWQSQWKKYLWPSLRINYGQNLSFDDQTPRATDSLSSHSGLFINWNLDLATFQYNLNQNEHTNNITDATNRNTNHFAAVNASRTFWDDRINVAFSQQYRTSISEAKRRAEQGGIALLPVTLSETRAGVDDPLALPDPPLDIKPKLRDTDLLTDADVTIDSTDQLMNFVVIQTALLAIDKIYLYTTTTLANANNFVWDIYYSNDGSDWTSFKQNAAFVYQSKRFEIELSGLKKNYIKLVTRKSEPATFTEIEAYRSVDAKGQTFVSDETKNTSLATNASFGFELTPDLNFAYNISLQATNNSEGSEQKSRSHSASIGWRQSQYVSYNLNVNESWSLADNNPESLARSYSLNVTSAILPSLDLRTSASLNESYTGGTKTTTTRNYNTGISARLFPDLTSNLNLSASENKNEETGTGTATRNTGLTMTARLSPKLTLNMNGNYNESMSATETTATQNGNLTLAWRPSDIISINSNASGQWTENDQTTTYGLNLSLAPTAKTQCHLNYSHTETTDSYDMGVDWSISSHFSLGINGNYLITEDENQWYINSLFNMRY